MGQSLKFRSEYLFMFGLEGKTALVTGASRGIGRAIALELAKNGCNVVINYLKNEEKAREVEKEIKKYGKAMIIKADVSRQEDVEIMRKEVIKNFRGVDILVNNAGIHQHLKSWELSIEDWEKVINVNLTGTFLCCSAFIPFMKKKRYGRIINISSVVAHTGTDHECHYASSKAGIIGLTKSLALELAPYNITVNAIAPGFIETDMLKFESEKERKRVEKKILLGRIGKPEEIAYATCFLASNMADYITGETLNVNGGLYIH